MTNTRKKDVIVGFVYFSIFAVLVAAGILVKRVYHHPEYMMFFHLPAAVFLVLATYKISGRVRNRYQQECDLIQARTSKTNPPHSNS